MSCSHPAIFKGMCVSCGLKVVQTQDSNPKGDKCHKTPFTVNGGHTMHLSAEEASIVQTSKINALRKTRKLALVLDLDHTLLHSTGQINPLHQTIKNSHLIILKENTYDYKYYIQFRPHLKKFLDDSNELFQLTIYTHGTRKYAEAVARLMDPDGMLFGKRIVSRTDQPDMGNDKSLGRLFLGDWSMAVVLDDRDDVWKGPQQAHVLTIMPFLHFTEEMDVSNNKKVAVEVNNSPGVATLSAEAGDISFPPCTNMTDNVETDDDSYLLSTLIILKKLHAIYFSSLDSFHHSTNNGHGSICASSSPPSAHMPVPNVANILHNMRLNTLKECYITFSMINASPNDISLPETILAQQVRLRTEHLSMTNLVSRLGGLVEAEVTDRTTHLICNFMDSPVAKLCWSRGDVHVVRPDWLLHCHWTLDCGGIDKYLLDSSRPKHNTKSLDSLPIEHLVKENTTVGDTNLCSHVSARPLPVEPVINVMPKVTPPIHQEVYPAEVRYNGLSTSTAESNARGSLKRRRIMSTYKATNVVVPLTNSSGVAYEDNNTMMTPNKMSVLRNQESTAANDTNSLSVEEIIVDSFVDNVKSEVESNGDKNYSDDSEDDSDTEDWLKSIEKDLES